MARGRLGLEDIDEDGVPDGCDACPDGDAEGVDLDATFVAGLVEGGEGLEAVVGWLIVSGVLGVAKELL